MGEAPDSRAGSMFGPYQLKRLLGRGGMGEVYEAEHIVKGWTVAVKLMSETVSKDPVFRERLSASGPPPITTEHSPPQPDPVPGQQLS
jgi:serine/threonine kinase PknH